jgi:outer membrane protein assembly factor BamB
MMSRFRYPALLIPVLVMLWSLPRGPAWSSDWPWPRHNSVNSAATSLVADFHEAPSLRWSFDLPVFDAGTYPVAADLDRDGRLELIVGDAQGTIYCLNAASGTLRWSRQLPSFFKWGSPVLVDLDLDGDRDIVVGARDLIALDGPTGQPLWTALQGVDVIGMSADDLFGDGTVEIFCTDYLNPRNGYLVRGEDGKVLWSKVTSGSNYNLPAFADLTGDGNKEIIFTRHDDGATERVVCLRAQDGQELWSHQCGPSAGQQAQAPPQLGYIADWGYQSVVVADFDGDGKLEVSSGTDLNHYLFEADGRLVWKEPQGILGTGFTRYHEIDGSSTFRDHHYQIYDQAVGDLDGNGTVDMAYGLVSDYITTYDVATGQSTVEFLAYRNDARAIRPDGSLLWNYHSSSDGAGVGRCRDPIIADLDNSGTLDVIYGSEDGHLYAVDGKSGQLLWRLHVGNLGMSRGKILVDTDGDGSGELIVVAGTRVLMYGRSLVGDIDGSGRVDGADLQHLAWSFGSSSGGERYLESADLDLSGVIDGEDLAILSSNFGNS